MTAPQTPSVTQADREAYLSLNNLPEFDRADVLRGLWDNTTGVQAFARHRSQSEAATITELVEALDNLANAARATFRFSSPWMLAEADKVLARHKAASDA